MADDSNDAAEKDAPPGTLGPRVRIGLALLSLVLLGLTVWFTGWRDTEPLPTVTLIITAAIAGFFACAGRLPMRLLVKDLGFDMTPEKVEMVETKTLNTILAMLSPKNREGVREDMSEIASPPNARRKTLKDYPVVYYQGGGTGIETLDKFYAGIPEKALRLAEQHIAFDADQLEWVRSIAESEGWSLVETDFHRHLDGVLTKHTPDGSYMRLGVGVQYSSWTQVTPIRNLMAREIAGNKIGAGLLVFRDRIELIMDGRDPYEFHGYDDKTISRTLRLAEQSMLPKE